MFQPCILCHFLLILQGGISLSSFGQGFGVGGLGTGVGLQHRNALNRNRCYWEGFGFQQWVCLLIHLLVWRCFERLDLLLIVCPASLFYLFFLGDAQDTSGIAKYSQHPQLAEFLHLCYPETKMAMVFHTPLGCSAAPATWPYGRTFSTSCSGSRSAKRNVIDSETSRHFSPWSANLGRLRAGDPGSWDQMVTRCRMAIDSP